MGSDDSVAGGMGTDCWGAGRRSHIAAYSEGDDEGRLFEPFTFELGLKELICEPTHFIGESKSCIDLIFTNQPNLFLETGVHPTLHEQCHHHIVFAKISSSNLAPPPYNRKFWNYDQALNCMVGRKHFKNSSVQICR